MSWSGSSVVGVCLGEFVVVTVVICGGIRYVVGVLVYG